MHKVNFLGFLCVCVCGDGMSLLSCVSRILVGSYHLNFQSDSGLDSEGYCIDCVRTIAVVCSNGITEIFENVEVCWLSAILFFFVLNNFDAFRNNICKMWWDNGRYKIAYQEVVVSC